MSATCGCAGPARRRALAYTIDTVPMENRTTAHLERQPFAQVPFLDDGDVKIFETGAGLLHLARKGDTLMPRDAAGAAETEQWVFAALNSVELVVVPWWYLARSGETDNALTEWLTKRLDQMEAVLASREWLAADRFTVADLVMADVLRLPELRPMGNRPATQAYIDRISSRPAFAKAHADQLAHFAAVDVVRAKQGDAG